MKDKNDEKNIFEGHFEAPWLEFAERIIPRQFFANISELLVLNFVVKAQPPS